MDGFEAGPYWEGKTSFAPGLSDDNAPTLRYQALHGRVYTLQAWPDGSTARGEVELAHLEALAGGPVKEGWYSALGEWVGASPGPLVRPEPEPTMGGKQS
jgi:hypothetical protein